MYLVAYNIWKNLQLKSVIKGWVAQDIQMDCHLKKYDTSLPPYVNLISDELII